MLYSESVVKGINAFDILSECVYIDNFINPKTIPVVENSDLGAAVVRFSDIESISECYGCDYIDAMIAVAEQNDIDPEYLAVAVDEARIIEEPELVNELANVVINPISQYDPEYMFCEECFANYLETGDESFLEEYLLQEGRFSKKIAKKKAARQTAAATAAANQIMGNTYSYKNTQPPIIRKSSPSTPPSNPEPVTSNNPTPVSNPEPTTPKLTHNYANDPDPIRRPKKPTSNKPEQAAQTGGKKFNWKYAAAAAGGAAAIGGLAAYAKKSDSSIFKKIASLRQMEKKTQMQAQQNPQKVGFFQRLIAKIKSMINYL